MGPAGIEPTTSTVESQRSTDEWVAPVIPLFSGERPQDATVKAL